MEHYKNLSLENIEGEEWRPVVGHENEYHISNLGRVKSIERLVINNKNGGKRKIKEAILVQIFNNKGYLLVSFNNKHKTVHRLVALTFIPNPQNKPEVNHTKGLTTDNRHTELEWATSKENQNHSYLFLGRKGSRPNLHKTGALSKISKQVMMYKNNSENVRVFGSAREAARNICGSQANISKCCKGQVKSAYGYIWKYITKQEYDNRTTNQTI